MFGDVFYQQLAPKRTRLITPYDSVCKDRRNLDAWLGAARAARQEVVVAFNPPARMECPNLDGARGCKLVSSASYRSAFRAFHARYPWVRIVQPWNEVNNLTQPTAHRPQALVTYYQIVRQVCRWCTVLGADIQDLPNMVSYTKSAAGRLPAHARRDAEAVGRAQLHRHEPLRARPRQQHARARQAAARQDLDHRDGRPVPLPAAELAPDVPARPQPPEARAMPAVFAEAARYQSKIERVYLYQGSPATRRTAGLRASSTRTANRGRSTTC